MIFLKAKSFKHSKLWAKENKGFLKRETRTSENAKMTFETHNGLEVNFPSLKHLAVVRISYTEYKYIIYGSRK